MKKTTSKKLKNSTLMALFFILVFVAIVVSIIVKVVLLITHSTFDNHHQFILEVKQPTNEEQIISFNPGSNEVAILHVKGIKNPQDMQTLQIPIDAKFTLSDQMSVKGLPQMLFTMIFHCEYPTCQNLNSVDALKLYMFAKHIRQNAIQTTDITLPPSQTDLKTTIPALFIDDTFYHEALSISVINASGEVGLGNEVSQLLTNIGGNILSVTSGDTQEATTMQSPFGQDTYSIQRLQKILHIQSQKMQKSGISDIIITIGRKHPQL
ncbi:MAG TPA: LytR C-terminal domain-containing protein [Candidatus Saccharimonadales bacterium]|nr:LytR C-terminal domain-containing protein [Candidatus Saccharimonadales bacterium]